ncbi:Sugar transporter ESL1 [Citrus sinensis]|uniref:Sugar transporter ESL1 n=1 Tax=Citrus sinensis TaxID=2711 RepID=A0ACB8KK56_CITSI|nr:Sugar transporter ESL1 [Citrus sinensis]
MENPESLEEGLIAKSSLAQSNPVIVTNEVGERSGFPESDNSSAATPVVVLSTLVAICGSFAYGCSVGYSSPAESGMRADLGLSVTEYSVFGSVLTFGGIIGSLVNGKIADPTGRRGAMWLSELFCIVGWLAIAFSKACHSICIIVPRQIPIYIAEITPKNIRGAFTATSQFLIVSGMSVMYLVGTIVSWRALALIAAVPCLLQVVGLFFIPESPRWLAKIGKEKELETTLQCLRGKTADISMESADIRDCTQTFEKDSKAGIFDLFQRRYAYSLSVGVGLMVMQPFVGSAAIAYYASYIIAAADLSTDIGSISMAIIQLPAIGASVLLTDRFGRRPLLLASTIWMGLSLTIIALAFGLQDTHLWNEATPVLVYVGIMGFSIAFALGMAGLPSVIMAEIFPINIKGSAGSLVILLHNCSNWIVTYTFHFTMEWSRTGTFSIFWVICAAGVAFVTFLVPATKGRTLEEIQASITKLSGR